MDNTKNDVTCNGEVDGLGLKEKETLLPSGVQ